MHVSPVQVFTVEVDEKHLAMWKADAEEREERREKGPTLGQIIFGKRFSRKIRKIQKSKIENQVQIFVSWKIKI